MSKLRKVSGEVVVKILCNRFGFEITGRSGSHVKLSKTSPKGKVGNVLNLFTSKIKRSAEIIDF